MLFIAFSACSAGGSNSTPGGSRVASLTSAALRDAAGAVDDVLPYTPGDEAPATIIIPDRPLTGDQRASEDRLGAQLRDPNRPVFAHYTHLRSPQNVVGSGDGEAVGMFTASSFAGEGSVTNLGVQLNYVVTNGGNFYHTHQFPNNQCFEYGINYTATAPTLFGYNWCTGGNTAPGFINKGLVGYPGGVLNSWTSSGHGGLLAWDSTMGIDKLSLEEIQENDGWHLLAYNWAEAKFYDIMNGQGVTGTKNTCCGWAVMEEHNTPGASCNFDPAFPKGAHLLYDFKKRVLIDGTWKTLDTVPSAGIWSVLSIDCVDLSGADASSNTSPYFSGEYFDAPGTGQFGPESAGSFWVTQR